MSDQPEQTQRVEITITRLDGTRYRMTYVEPVLRTVTAVRWPEGEMVEFQVSGYTSMLVGPDRDILLPPCTCAVDYRRNEMGSHHGSVCVLHVRPGESMRMAKERLIRSRRQAQGD